MMCIPLIALSPLRTMIIDLTIVISVVVSQVSNNKCIKILTMTMTMKMMMLMSNMKYEYLVWYYILCKNIRPLPHFFLFSSASLLPCPRHLCCLFSHPLPKHLDYLHM